MGGKGKVGKKPITEDNTVCGGEQKCIGTKPLKITTVLKHSSCDKCHRDATRLETHKEIVLNSQFVK